MTVVCITFAVTTALVLFAACRVFERLTHAHEQQLSRLLDTPNPDSVALIALVETLCQRIQAPQVAVAQHAAEGLPGYAPPAVSIEDDGDYWAAQLSKEDLAEQMMAQETV